MQSKAVVQHVHDGQEIVRITAREQDRFYIDFFFNDLGEKQVKIFQFREQFVGHYEISF